MPAFAFQTDRLRFFPGKSIADYAIERKSGRGRIIAKKAQSVDNIHIGS
ncbi:hypothetical protein HMPREF9141_1846 [Prevotella multiformis DSM 16608]|uniref:Uncharacterized protein n=1 Tax=Prevotella multiformis DSM 16608 TaxID=888743 RepID=F0F8C9_9BACT|nr:hypothetical protein HMPREF9141_1846 [Prevotella multiformis DSM 16608]